MSYVDEDVTSQATSSGKKQLFNMNVLVNTADIEEKFIKEFRIDLQNKKSSKNLRFIRTMCLITLAILISLTSKFLNLLFLISNGLYNQNTKCGKDN